MVAREKCLLFILLILSFLTISCTDSIEYNEKKDLLIKSNFPLLNKENIRQTALTLANNWLIHGHQDNGFQQTNFTDNP